MATTKSDQHEALIASVPSVRRFTMDNWEAKVVFQPGRMTNAIYLTRKRQPGVREYLLSDNTVVTTNPDNMPLKDDPAFAFLDDDQIRALVIAFDTYGIKRPEASYTQGKLEATTEHLGDLRKLVFEPGVIKVIQKGEVK